MTLHHPTCIPAVYVSYTGLGLVDEALVPTIQRNQQACVLHALTQCPTWATHVQIHVYPDRVIADCGLYMRNSDITIKGTSLQVTL